MLNHKITQQENAIEKHFCEPFSKLNPFPMSKEDTGILMKLLLTPELKSNQLPDKEKPFLLKVIEKRLPASYSYLVNDNRLLMFLTVLCETPGTAIMYLTYLQYWCNKNSQSEIDLDKFCEIFPDGFPCKSDLSKLWDSQKVKVPIGISSSDNLIDYQSAMKSIHIN